MMRRARLFVAAAGVVVSLAPAVLAAQARDAWIDPSPHSTTFVTVEDGVRLEVLDWGGSGRPILLLAGLGDTAHVFDDFGPRLAERHRVYAMTRRGFGESSAPEHGYDVGRLADDVMAVVKALELDKPVVVGHSFAGEEMHVVGSRYAEEVAGLVYVDAAFNRADGSEDYDAKSRELPRAPAPQPADLRTLATARDFFARNGLPQYPEAAMRNRFVVDAEGNIGGQRTPAPAVREGYTKTMSEALRDYHPEPIRVPALAIYAVPQRVEDMMHPWYDQGEASLQRTVQELFVLARDRYRRHAEWFRSLAGGSSRSTGMAGDHHLFLTSREKVEEEIEAFASSLR